MTLFTSTPYLHNTEHDAKFQATHLGQAHLAGTGPKGKTCRECIFYGKDLKGWPDYYASGRSQNQLKQSTCRNPMPGKSNRKFPHHASSCVLFEQNAAPPLISKPEA